MCEGARSHFLCSRACPEIALEANAAARSPTRCIASNNCHLSAHSRAPPRSCDHSVSPTGAASRHTMARGGVRGSSRNSFDSHRHAIWCVRCATPTEAAVVYETCTYIEMKAPTDGTLVTCLRPKGICRGHPSGRARPLLLQRTRAYVEGTLGPGPPLLLQRMGPCVGPHLFWDWPNAVAHTPRCANKLCPGCPERPARVSQCPGECLTNAHRTLG